MRPLPLIAALAAAASLSQAAAGCGAEDPVRAPPLGAFYFPTGVVHLADPDGGPGRLLVASSNFDKRYDFGAVTALDLSRYPVTRRNPAGTGEDGGVAPLDGGVGPAVTVEDLAVEEGQRVLVSSFTGAMDVYRTDQGGLRAFVPARSEGDRLFAIEVDGASLSCLGADPAERNCAAQDGGISLTGPALDGAEGFSQDLPRAPAPYSVTVDQADGRLFVTHLVPADSPATSLERQQSFLVQLDAEAPQVTAGAFFPLGVHPVNSVALGGRYAYLAGRDAQRNSEPPALRLFDLDPSSFGAVLEIPLQERLRVSDARDAVLSEDERRVFLVGRDPDVLLVASVERRLAERPLIRLVRAVPLPADPDQAVLIPRGPGRGALVAITCSGADAVALYDDEVGGLAAIVPGVGRQPWGISVQMFQTAAEDSARLFVTAFGSGQVAVIDIPDVTRPFGAALVARLGEAQRCITQPEEVAECAEVTP